MKMRRGHYYGDMARKMFGLRSGHIFPLAHFP
jgi:hypothetical protein